MGSAVTPSRMFAPGDVSRVVLRAVLDLGSVGCATALATAVGGIPSTVVPVYIGSWFAAATLLGAYEGEYRLPGRDALVAGLLLALPAALLAALLTRSLLALLLVGLAPLSAISLTSRSSRSPTIDELSGDVHVLPPANSPSRLTRLRVRVWDIISASVGLLVAVPLIAGVWVAGRIWDPGPLTFRQARIGLDGRPFSIVKCRTMVVDADRDGAVWTIQGDPRITRVGRFLRQTRIDELPQLWNVLVGEMSIVGPRPEQVPLVEELRCHYPTYDARHQVKPGLTGLSQVCVGYTATVEESGVKLARDLYYVAHQSVGLNFAISARTIRTVLAMAGR